MAMKQINFYARYAAAAKSGRSAKRTKTLLWAAPAVVIVLVCMGVWVALRVHTAMLTTRSDALYSWCTDSAQLTPYSQYVNDKQQGSSYRGLSDYAAGVTRLLNSYPSVTSSLMERITAAGGPSISIKFTGYNAATGELTFDASSSEVIDIPSYIRALEGCGAFARVSYTGYAAAGERSATEDDAGGNNYTIKLSCILAAPEEAAQ